MPIIDLTKIRATLPKRGEVSIKKNKKKSLYIECIVRFPSLYKDGTKEEEKKLGEVIRRQCKIIGEENISEIYTEETGSHWLIYLKNNIPFDFIDKKI